MKGNMNDLIKQTKINIKEGKKRVIEIESQIQEYEGIIDAISFTEQRYMVKSYYKKVDKCYAELEEVLDSIERNKNIINALKSAEEIVRRGEKCA